MNLLVTFARCFDGYNQLSCFNRRVNFTAVPHRGADCPIKLNEAVNYYASEGDYQGNEQQNYTDTPQNVIIMMNGPTVPSDLRIVAIAGSHSEALQQIVWRKPDYLRIILVALSSFLAALVLLIGLHFSVRWCLKLKSKSDMRHFVEDQMEKSLLLGDMDYVMVDECDDLGNCKKRPGQLVDLRA